MKPAWITGASLALSLALAQGAAAQVAATDDNPVRGAIDFHVLTSPDVSSRNLTDIELARIAARYEMGGLVLKNHVTMTADRAAIVNEMVPEPEVVGGIVLNDPVGGINAAAVTAMAKISGGRGKVVWFPTNNAAYHIATKTDRSGGITVFDAQNALTSDTEEVLAVLRRAQELGIDKMVVTHAMAENPGLNIEQMKQAAALGAHLELIYLDHLGTPHAHMDWLRKRKPNSIADMAAAVREIGAEHFILASDLGQTGNPIHPDGMVELIKGLTAEGIPPEDIDVMVRANPAKLLGL